VISCVEPGAGVEPATY